MICAAVTEVLLPLRLQLPGHGMISSKEEAKDMHSFFGKSLLAPVTIFKIFTSQISLQAFVPP